SLRAAAWPRGPSGDSVRHRRRGLGPPCGCRGYHGLQTFRNMNGARRVIRLGGGGPLAHRTLILGLAALLSACSHNSPPQGCEPTGPCVPAACERPIATSSLPASQVIALGVHRVGDVVPFTVPAGTASMTIVHQAQTAGIYVVFSHGDVWFNNAVP